MTSRVMTARSMPARLSPSSKWRSTGVASRCSSRRPKPPVPEARRAATREVPTTRAARARRGWRAWLSRERILVDPARTRGTCGHTGGEQSGPEAGRAYARAARVASGDRSKSRAGGGSVRVAPRALQAERTRSLTKEGNGGKENVGRRASVWCLLAPSRGGVPLLGETRGAQS